MLLGAAFGFMTIYAQLYDILSIIWGQSLILYSHYVFSLVIFVSMIMVAAMSAIYITYAQLWHEDHQ